MMRGWGMKWLDMIIMLIFWVIVIIGLGFLIKWLIPTTNEEQHVICGGPNALGILRDHYAKGEITRKDFGQMKNNITG